MTVLAAYKTASGNQIQLVKASAPGHAEVHINGKFGGMLDAIKAHPQHGNVIAIKGSQSMVAIPADCLSAVESGMQLMSTMDAEKAAQTAAKIAAYAQTSEGKSEALMARIHDHDDAGGRDRSERF
jgi:hypothetical protein